MQNKDKELARSHEIIREHNTAKALEKREQSLAEDQRLVDKATKKRSKSQDTSSAAESSLKLRSKTTKSNNKSGTKTTKSNNKSGTKTTKLNTKSGTKTTKLNTKSNTKSGTNTTKSNTKSKSKTTKSNTKSKSKTTKLDKGNHEHAIPEPSDTDRFFDKILKHSYGSKTKRATVDVKTREGETIKGVAVANAWVDFPNLLGRYCLEKKLLDKHKENNPFITPREEDATVIERILGHIGDLKNLDKCKFTVSWQNGWLERNIKYEDLKADTEDRPDFFDRYIKAQKDETLFVDVTSSGEADSAEELYDKGDDNFVYESSDSSHWRSMNKENDDESHKDEPKKAHANNDDANDDDANIGDANNDDANADNANVDGDADTNKDKDKDNDANKDNDTNKDDANDATTPKSPTRKGKSVSSREGEPDDAPTRISPPRKAKSVASKKLDAAPDAPPKQNSPPQKAKSVASKKLDDAPNCGDNNDETNNEKIDNDDNNNDGN